VPGAGFAGWGGPVKQTLLEKLVAHRKLRIEIAPFDGRLVVSIGSHHEGNGRGVWLNIDVRDLPDVMDALDRACAIANV
jgi:hypothetical protein